VLRGSNEHGSACGAMARWQLAEEPFAVITWQRHDRRVQGVLANAGWQTGLHRVPRRRRTESRSGTISVDEDTREVLRARRIPRLPERPEDTSRDLEEAFALYHEGGPVVLLAAQTVLEFSTPLGRLVAVKPVPPGKRGTGREPRQAYK